MGNDDALSFIEDFGEAMESMGLGRAVGKVMGWLLVSNPPEQSAEELARALNASAGGISTSVRVLTQLRFVERVGKSGDRRWYYRITPHAWAQMMASQEKDMTTLRKFAERGLETLAGSDQHVTARLEEMKGFFAFMEREMPELTRRYNEERGVAK